MRWTSVLMLAVWGMLFLPEVSRAAATPPDLSESEQGGKEAGKSNSSGGTLAAEKSEGETSTALPATSELPSIPKLPDPFRFMDGTRMTCRDDWARRRTEISRLVQEYVYGPKPPKPSEVTGTYRDDRLTVKCSKGEKSISFTARISHPPEGSPPYPAIISVGPWLTLPGSELDKLGIAVIYFPNDELGR